MVSVGPRRFLPSISLLRAFEAAARTGSVTAAAKELSLTQSAVSRQIKALENQLEVELFHRERQTIRLTLGGDAYLREIRSGLHRISTATLNLRASPKGGTLNLATLPMFGMRWLVPRLPDFLSKHRDVTVNLSTRLSHFDFRSESIDAAVHFGRPEWQGSEMILLGCEYVVPVCSASMKRKYGFGIPSDLRKAPLLHLDARPDAWERWLRFHDVQADGVHGMLFDQFGMMAEAAVAGIGVALLPIFLINDELQSGRLVRAVDMPMKSEDSYFLVWPVDRRDHQPLSLFRDWIQKVVDFRV